MGNTRLNAVMASSLMRATNRLSTMLYRLFTSMEITLGSAIESSSGSTGFSFIKVSFIEKFHLLSVKNKNVAGTAPAGSRFPAHKKATQ